MQAFQVDTVPSSLNSSYCYILHSGSTVITWFGNLMSPEGQELVKRQLDIIKSRQLKEGAELEQFWQLLGPKTEYSSQKIGRKSEGKRHFSSCSFSKDYVQEQEMKIKGLEAMLMDEFKGDLKPGYEVKLTGPVGMEKLMQKDHNATIIMLRTGNLRETRGLQVQRLGVAPLGCTDKQFAAVQRDEGEGSTQLQTRFRGEQRANQRQG